MINNRNICNTSYFSSKYKESSSNIESSSSIDLSAEQKKRISECNIGPDSQRISQEVEEVIKRIENKKKGKN